LKFHFSKKMAHYLQRRQSLLPCAESGCGNEVTFERPLPPTGFSFKNCRCPRHPPVCDPCRRANQSDHVCRWCGETGHHTTVKPPIRSDLLKCYRDWVEFRTECVAISATPQLAEMATHWNKFLQLYDMFAKTCEDEQKMYFRMRFLHSQMFSKIPRNLRLVYRLSYRVWWINRGLFYSLKQISLARVLVCNLLGQERCALFQQSYCVYVKASTAYEHKLMFFVIRRLIAIVLHWNQISDELN
jgi:hypothetical protein